MIALAVWNEPLRVMDDEYSPLIQSPITVSIIWGGVASWHYACVFFYLPVFVSQRLRIFFKSRRSVASRLRIFCIGDSFWSRMTRVFCQPNISGKARWGKQD